MNDLAIHAASYLGPEGFGNDLTGLRAWPSPLKENLSRGELDGLHWSLLAASDPSRFLRMDLMCRLGFMAAELLAVNFDTLTAARREHLGVRVECQVPITVYDEDGTVLGDFVADLLIEGVLIVELKACRAIAEEHVAQILGYLRATRIERGLLINFGAKKYEIRKYIFSDC